MRLPCVMPIAAGHRSMTSPSAWSPRRDASTRCASSTGGRAGCWRWASAPGCRFPATASHLTITGIDLSPEMLAKAEDKVERKKLDNVVALHEMDAGALAFPDESFDTVVAMYVMTVVPEPERVMRELERVCAPGGEVILVNHFSQEEGMRGWLERKLAPFADLHRLAPGVRARPGAGLRGSPPRRAPIAYGRSASSPCSASSRSRALGWRLELAQAARLRKVKGADGGARAPARAHQGEDQMAGRARAGACRRLLDTQLLAIPISPLAEPIGGVAQLVRAAES